MSSLICIHNTAKRSLRFQVLASNCVYLCTKVADFKTELGLTFCRVHNVLNVVQVTNAWGTEVDCRTINPISVRIDYSTVITQQYIGT